MADDAIVFDGADGTFDYPVRGAISITRGFEITNKPSAVNIGTTFLGRRQPMTLTAEVTLSVQSDQVEVQGGPAAGRLPNGLTRVHNETAAVRHFLGIQVKQFTNLAGKRVGIYCNALPDYYMTAVIVEASIKDDGKWDNAVTGIIQAREFFEFDPNATDDQGFSLLGNDFIPAPDSPNGLPGGGTKTCIPVASLTYDFKEIFDQELKFSADVDKVNTVVRQQYMGQLTTTFNAYLDKLIANNDQAGIAKLEQALGQNVVNLSALFPGAPDTTPKFPDDVNNRFQQTAFPISGFPSGDRAVVVKQLQDALRAKLESSGAGPLTTDERQAIIQNYMANGGDPTVIEAYRQCVYQHTVDPDSGRVDVTNGRNTDSGMRRVGGGVYKLDDIVVGHIRDEDYAIITAACPLPFTVHQGKDGSGGVVSIPVSTRADYIAYFNVVMSNLTGTQDYGVCAE